MMHEAIGRQVYWVDCLVKFEMSESAETRRNNYAGLDDQLLIQFALRRDSEAIDTLVRRYTPLLIGFLRGRIPRAYEDVYQETFALALSRLDTLRQRDRFGPWLLKIAEREIVNWARSDARHAATRDPEQVAAAIHGVSSSQPLDESALAEQAQIIIDSILDQPEPYRLILYLSLIHEKEPQAIAQELGLRPGTVRMRLKRGLSKLRKSMKRKGLE